MSEAPGPLVTPGERLGTAEEFVPGHGTYEDHGQIYAALLGHREVDGTDRAVHVRALHAIPHLAEGDLVYARVDEIKTAMLIVTIVADARSGREVPANPEGTVHISKAKEGYTESLGGEFAAGDVIVARILQSRPGIKLTTAAPDLGVLTGHCTRCHALMVPEGGKLHCPRCGHVEGRKLAHGSHSLPPHIGPGDAPLLADF